jgi:hypothetical protein
VKKLTKVEGNEKDEEIIKEQKKIKRKNKKKRKENKFQLVSSCFKRRFPSLYINAVRSDCELRRRVR